MAENILNGSKFDFAGLSNENLYNESAEVSKMSQNDKIKYVNKLYLQ